MVGSRVGGSEAAAPSPCKILHALAKGITYVGSVSNSCAVWVSIMAGKVCCGLQHSSSSTCALYRTSAASLCKIYNQVSKQNFMLH